MNTLVWVQESAFATWVRESDWALFAFLIVHTMGMGFLIGSAIAFHLRILGVASGVDLAKFAKIAPVMVLGALAAIASGLLLVIAYPAKALTNSIFYLKLALIVAALVLTRKLLRAALREHGIAWLSSSAAKYRAAFGIALWVAALTAGKFLPYTNKVLLVYS